MTQQITQTSTVGVMICGNYICDIIHSIK